MFLWFLAVYLLGGLTFLPLVVFVFWKYGQGPALPQEPELEPDNEPLDLLGEDEPLIPINVTEKPQFSGWVTVTKEYFEYPSGDVPDKKENPSAYTSLYKLANGNGNGNGNGSDDSQSTSPSPGATAQPSTSPSSPSPAVQAATTAAASSKPKTTPVKSRYYAELKLGNLFLYKSEERDLQHAIVLNKYRVQLYPELPDANLLAKRVAVCLTHTKKDLNYFIFLENCSLKEDLYFKIVELTCHNTAIGQPLLFQRNHMISIIQKLHSSDENLQTAWFNALMARMFMSGYQTDAFRGYFEEKIVKKLARVKRPAFLGEIEVTKIDVGNSIPFLTTPKLRELKPDGTLVVAAHLSYAGGYSIEITTKATFNFGQKLINIKPRPMTIVLRLTLSKMEGIVVFQIKPPPSTRIWWGFESMPEMSLKVEPVVSARQITYSMITNVIESKIRETVKESIVLPFTEDINFFPSQEGNPYRGGLWEDHRGKEEASSEDAASCDASGAASVGGGDDESILEDTPPPSIHVGMRHRTFRSRTPDEEAEEAAAAAAAVSGASSSAASGTTLASAAASASSLANIQSPSDADSIKSTSPMAQNFMGTMKKWGAWYTEKKNESVKKAKPVGGFASVPRAATSPSLTADATVSLSPAAAITHRKTPAEKRAPQPHHFPPEMIDLINEQERKRKLSNPDQPIGMEMPGSPPLPQTGTGFGSPKSPVVGVTAVGPPPLPPRANTIDTDKSQFVKRKPVRVPVGSPPLQSSSSPPLPSPPVTIPAAHANHRTTKRETGVPPLGPPVTREAGVSPKLPTSRSRDSLASMASSSFRDDSKVSVVSLPVEEGSPPKEALVFSNTSHKSSPLSAVQTPPASDPAATSGDSGCRVPRKPVAVENGGEGDARSEKPLQVPRKPTIKELKGRATTRRDVNGDSERVVLNEKGDETEVKGLKEVKEVTGVTSVSDELSTSTPTSPSEDTSHSTKEEETFPLEL